MRIHEFMDDGDSNWPWSTLLTLSDRAAHPFFNSLYTSPKLIMLGAPVIVDAAL